MDRLTGRWMDGNTNGQKGRWTDRQKDRQRDKEIT